MRPRDDPQSVECEHPPQSAECGHPPGPPGPQGPSGQSAAVSVQSADLELFRLACEHFRQDIAAHWSQAGIFAVIQAAFISFFAATVGPQDQDSTRLVSSEAQAVGLAAAGFVFALLWLAMAYGRECYIKRWRSAVIHLDRVVDRHHVYVDIEEFAKDDRWNPTRLATALPGLLLVGWLVVGIVTLVLWLAS